MTNLKRVPLYVGNVTQESNVKRVIPHYYKAFYKEMARIRATADTNVRRKLVTLNCIKSMCRLLLGNLQPFAVVAL